MREGAAGDSGACQPRHGSLIAEAANGVSISTEYTIELCDGRSADVERLLNRSHAINTDRIQVPRRRAIQGAEDG